MYPSCLNCNPADNKLLIIIVGSSIIVWPINVIDCRLSPRFSFPLNVIISLTAPIFIDFVKFVSVCFAN